MSRRSEALKQIDLKKGRGLELGPLYSPVISKDEARVEYVDHMSIKDLRKKYAGHHLPFNQFVSVDHVLINNSLKQTLKSKKYDYIVASHVIEHIPDMVSWLKDVASVLSDGGILSLVIPDKRYTFDILRNESRPADVIGAYLDKYTRASSAIMYDYTIEFRNKIVPEEVCNNPYADYSKKPKNSLNRVWQDCLDNLKPNNYVDSHCNVFTPYSFFNILRSLIEHDLFDYEVAYFSNTPINQLEFYVSLRRSNKARATKLKTLPIIATPPELREVQKELEAVKKQLANTSEDSKKELEAVKKQLIDITESKSWQITQPLRSVSKIAKGMKGRFI
jgi:hypothetical protein